MTQLSTKQHQTQMAGMKSFDEKIPCVGIFWYDTQENTSFGAHKQELTLRMVWRYAVNIH